MNLNPPFIGVSTLAFATLLCIGCSEPPRESSEKDSTKEDTVAIERLFQEMKNRPNSIELYPPNERPLAAYVEVYMASFVIAVQDDQSTKQECERELAKLIAKHGLTDTLEFTDNEARMRAVATNAFATVDLPVFMTDIHRFKATYSDTTSENVSFDENEDVAIPVSIMEMKLDGDEAKATILYSDETEQPVVFVKSDAKWFVSWERTHYDPEEGSDWTTPKTFIITFDSQNSLENATAKSLLKGVDYDRSWPATLMKTQTPLQAELEYYVAVPEWNEGEESDSLLDESGTTPQSIKNHPKAEERLEASIRRYEATIESIENHPGVTKVESSFAAEFREAMESPAVEEQIQAAFRNPENWTVTPNGDARSEANPGANNTPLERPQEKQTAMEARVIASQRERAESGQPTAQYDLGMRYLEGNGIPQDDSMARYWLQRSADQGSTQARRALDKIAN